MNKNSFTNGIGWRGHNGHHTVASQQMMITYLGVTYSLTAWATALHVSPGTLRQKMARIESGTMSWDEAMAGKEERIRLQVERHAAAMVRKKENKKTGVNVASKAMDSFLFRSAAR